MNLYLKNLSQEKQQKKGETNCDKGIYRKKLLTPNRERNEIRVSFILNKEKEKGRRKKNYLPRHHPTRPSTVLHDSARQNNTRARTRKRHL